jgi:A/G-specific adenine glycosylase
VQRELREQVLSMAGVVISPGRKVATIRHSVTRYRITLHCYSADYVRRGHAAPPGPPLKWVSPAQFEAYPLSTSGRRFGQVLAAQLSRAE